MKSCSIDTCSKNAKKAGLCWAHHKKKLVFGDPLYGREYLPNPTGLCSVDGCGKKYLARGFCAMHYARVKLQGQIGPTGHINRKPHRLPCSVSGCACVSAHKGVCRKHYRSSYRSSRLCTIQGCVKPHEAKGCCRLHYERLRLYGNPLAEKPKRGYHKLPIGYRYITNTGYVMVLVGKGHQHANKNGFAFEHRLVMGEHIGRSLHRFENVHHKDGNRKNNALENLELWTTMQPSGQRPADLVEYAKKILSIYGDGAY